MSTYFFVLTVFLGLIVPLRLDFGGLYAFCTVPPELTLPLRSLLSMFNNLLAGFTLLVFLAFLAATLLLV